MAVMLFGEAAVAHVRAQDRDKPPAPAASQDNKPADKDRLAGQKARLLKKLPRPAKDVAAEELQQAISNAGSDRAALARNLEAYLVKYPDSPQKPQIYRALVEAHLQLRDTTRRRSTLSASWR